jgi:fructose-bisphosphate aldolase class II
LEAAVAQKSPVILQTSEGAIDYAGLEYLSALAHVAAQAPVPVVFHVDHGKNYEHLIKFVKSGEYTSVMFDGSSRPYHENLALTRELVQLAHRRGISVEAELGAIRGSEDKVNVAARDASFTKPEEAWEFVSESGCDALAISIGTAHGAFKFTGTPKLDFKRLSLIRKLVKIPLVLHGASAVPAKYVKIAESFGAKLKGARGVPDASVRQAIRLGIRKVNIDTDLRIAFMAGVRQALAEDSTVFDPRKILGPAKAYIRELAEQKIRLLGANGKA